GLRGRLDIRSGADRHRGPTPPPRLGPVGQLAEGCPRRAVRYAVRQADLPEEPLPEARAHEARRISPEGDQAPDPAPARSGRLEEAERVKGLGRIAGPGRLVALGLGILAVAGCSAFRRAPLDVPPGHQVVLGEVAIAGFSESQVVLDIL